MIFGRSSMVLILPELKVDHTKGDPENPMTADNVTENFLDYTSFSMKPLTKTKIVTIIDSILNLEKRRCNKNH